MSSIILPNQLFKDLSELKNVKTLYLIEHPIYFTKYNFHPLKLIFHRATMKYYQDYINKKYNFNIKYINFDNYNINTFKNQKIIMFDPTDLNIYKEFRKLDIEYLESPLFLTPLLELKKYIKNNSFIHKNFYIWQRKRMNIFIDKTNKPYYGNWSFDRENREKFPKNQKEPSFIKMYNNKYILEAKKYIISKFNVDKEFGTDIWIPITHKESEKYFISFIEKKIKLFGKYQDAANDDIIVGYHSAISPLLNVGLLTPDYVVEKIIKYFEKNKNKELYYSIEGYIRQIIGWREYVRMVYLFKTKDLIKNKLKHKNKLLPITNLNTNIYPIDNLIKKTKKWCWLHHIERLMFIGNYFFLCKIDPKEVMKFYMENISLDAYDWVMIPNIYGMSQYSGLNIMTNRPYFSSSNYLLKMSNYKRGEWCNIWDALYYNFINDHQDILKNNYSTAISVINWNKKTKIEKEEIIEISHKYIKTITRS